MQTYFQNNQQNNFQNNPHNNPQNYYPPNNSQNLNQNFRQSFGLSFSQQVKQQIPQNFKQQCECPVCCNNYNLNNRVPMNICELQHHCCLQCVNKIIVRKKECPFCKKKIFLNRIFKNRMIAKMIEDAAKKKGIPIKIAQNPENKINGLQQYNQWINVNKDSEESLLQPLAPPQPQRNNPQNQRNRRQVNRNLVNVENNNRGCLSRLGFYLYGNVESGMFKITIISLLLFIAAGLGQLYLVEFAENKQQWLDKTYLDMKYSMGHIASLSAWGTVYIGGVCLLSLILMGMFKSGKYFLFIFYLLGYLALCAKVGYYSWIAYDNYSKLVYNSRNESKNWDLAQCMGFYDFYYTTGIFVVMGWDGIWSLILVVKLLFARC